MQEKFGSILRKARESSGLSVEEVCTKLFSLGFKISPKTLYGYENDVSAPKISLFMALCQIYEISDISSSFNVAPAPASHPLFLSEHERQVVLAYRSRPDARPFVDQLLGVEPEASSLSKQA